MIPYPSDDGPVFVQHIFLRARDAGYQGNLSPRPFVLVPGYDAGAGFYFKNLRDVVRNRAGGLRACAGRNAPLIRRSSEPFGRTTLDARSAAARQLLAKYAARRNLPTCLARAGISGL